MDPRHVDRREISAWYDRDGVAERFERYQEPGTDQYRHRRFERRVVERLLSAMPPGLTVLDFPCGTGRYAGLADRFAFSTGSDISFAMLDRARNAYQALCQADAFRLPFRDRAFGLTLCMRFLHHVPDQAQRRRCLAELGRVTGETLVLSYFERRSLKHLARRFRAWRRGRPTCRFATTLQILRPELAEAGFTVEKAYSPLGLLSENRVLLCRKS